MSDDDKIERDPDMQRKAWLWIGAIYTAATVAAVICKLTGVL